MDNPQHYQPLSAAITPSPYITHQGRSPQQLQYPTYAAHIHQPTASTSANQRQEEEEEEEEDVEGELDPNQHDSAQSSPRPAQSGSASTAHQYSNQNPDQAHSQHNADDGQEKRKPGRPRGSRNRKPRAPASNPANASKAPTNTQHPGFYSYPPAPGGQQAAQNQQFYEFQWRALNLCSEFYKAAEELIKGAPPMVIAQCYQMGPVQKIDPLGLITEAKRVCDNLLANPSQLVGTVPPPVYQAVPQYGQMPPPPPPPTSAPAGSASVITNSQSFVMSLSAPGMPAAHAAPYYPQVYAAPGQRYPTTVTTPYYPYPQGAPAYYPPQLQPPQPQPQPQSQPPQQHAQPAPPAPTSISAPPATTAATAAPAPPSGTLSTFNAATGNVAPGGQQGTWSEDETERLRRLAEQSREANKGEIEWDWVITQWGNSRTRHQILLKATSMGLKESTTRGTKRRREPDHAGSDSQAANAASAGAPGVSSASATPSLPAAVIPAPSQSPAMQQNHTTPTQTHTTINSAPTSVAPSRTQNTQPQTHTPTTATAASTHPWPPPTIAANIPSPVMVHSQPDPSRMTTGNNTIFRRPSGAQQAAYGTLSTSPTTQHSRPPSSQAGQSAQHQFMYRPNDGRRENGYS
ncbi:hypothetical protein QCA50_005932 [Cerrena zonata]|uniref:Myb-like domain-containing protein n=1 Tax=Cerrena zonata TaxID=2478898 RepID=A0AAW0GBT7_9APHY